MSFFGQNKRATPSAKSGRRHHPLPLSNSDVINEKFSASYGHSRRSSLTTPLVATSGLSGWFTVIYIPIPGFLSRGGSGGGGSSVSPLSAAGGGGRNRSGSLTANGGASFDGMGGYGNVGSRYSSAGSNTMRSPSRGHIPLYLPIPSRIWARLPGAGRPTPLRLCLIFFIFLGTIILITGFHKKDGGGTAWHGPFLGDPSTLVITKEEVARIWQWEVMSGHHPSVKQVPEGVPLPPFVPNPAVPLSLLPNVSDPQVSSIDESKSYLNANAAGAAAAAGRQPSINSRPKTRLVGTGPERRYLPIITPSPPWDESSSKNSRQQKSHSSIAFPPRPVPGTVADLDLLLERCDFSTNQYVRDCLELLRIGGHLDNGRRYRRQNMTNYQYIFEEDYSTMKPPQTLNPSELSKLMLGKSYDDASELEVEAGGVAVDSRRERSLSRTPLTLPAPLQPGLGYQSNSACDPRYPRIFHMFWAGPFTDKPYMAVMSFLYTQNLGLDLPAEKRNDQTEVCRPQFWVWINPGPAAAIPNASARREMYEALAVNPWSAPFLHARFKDVVKFKMWNTTEQLDGIHELKDHWRQMPIFKSGGQKFDTPGPQTTEEPSFVDRDIDESGDVTRTLTDADGVVVVETDSANERADGDKPPASATAPPTVVKKGKGGLFEKVGSTSENDYDRLSVVLSDMARFILTHRFGGIYLDADTLFLRDWEELWNWKGQFAYRWSFHQKYNTAVLKLHKNSALSTFLFKAALENGMDFHPMTVSRYLKDADLDPLLFRIPDALFDPAWLNMEDYQRDRPPFPYFPAFNDFFSNNKFHTSGPHPLGFDAFFRGSYSYHFHNFW